MTETAQQTVHVMQQGAAISADTRINRQRRMNEIAGEATFEG